MDRVFVRDARHVPQIGSISIELAGVVSMRSDHRQPPLSQWRLLLLAVAMIGFAPLANAGAVVNVTPANLREYLRTHPQVVVEFNSPDPRCGYCGKAVDAAFQEVGNGFADDIAFVRVQWVPWSSIPAEIKGLGVGGVPMHQVFRNGASVSTLYGKIAKPVDYAATLRTFFPAAAVRAAPVPAPAAPVAPAGPVPTGPITPVVVPSAVAKGINPIAECRQFRAITDFENIPWKDIGADATFCGQTAVGVYPADFPGGIAAFERRQLIGLRDYREPAVHSRAAAALALGTLVKSGYTETPGELWWGLFNQPSSGMRHMAVGQETFTRLLASLQGTDPLRAAYLLMGKVPVPYPRTPDTAYAFVDSTPVTSRDYLGGRGAVGEGRVTRADLKVSTLDPIHGEMTMDLEIEGVAHSLTIPLKRNVLETSPNLVLRGGDMNQLVAGHASGGAVVDCLESITSAVRSSCSMHLAESPVGSEIRYQAQGFFFGPQSNVVVVTYTFNNLWWTGKNGSRSFGTSSGLIVFSAR